MPPLTELFEKNRAWSERMRTLDSAFFSKLSQQQHPRYLWIGCADSRVPANEIVGLAPGELFVHRNIANVVVHSDLNCLSVIQFAVDVLRVEHIIVCGHYGCTGVSVAMHRHRVGLADNWLRHVQDVHAKHDQRMSEVEAAPLRVDLLCELNVIEQVNNVCQTTIVNDAWDRGQALSVHGWVYGLKDGLVRDLHTTVANASELAPAYQAAVKSL